jgi:hypothetical protein
MLHSVLSNGWKNLFLFKTVYSVSSFHLVIGEETV